MFTYAYFDLSFKSKIFIMNKILLSLIGFTSFTAVSQANLDANNIDARFNNNGIFFQDQGLSFAGYEFPKDSNTHVIYAQTLWMGGLDTAGLLHLACDSYYTDFSTGPVANDYNSAYYTSTFGTSVWKITRDQVINHLGNYWNVGYTPDLAIIDWPGNGNTAEGVAAQLAPYVDVNGDQIYNPLDGDYPYFQGDQAVFIILNDLADTPHVNTGATPLGVEVHLMFSQFSSTVTEVNNTTFANAKIINRSSLDYTDFIFSIWTDFDIGFSNDDFVGSDSLTNMAYGYNASPIESGGSGQNAYGSNPPACGVKFLNHVAGGAMYHSSGGGPTGDPNTATDFYNYMNNKFLNGAPLTYGGTGFGGTVPVDFIYSAPPTDTAGWSEFNEGTPGGDRRILLNGSPVTLAAGDELCIDYAIVTDNSQNDHFQNVDGLINAAAVVQNFYDTNIQPCNMIFLSAEEHSEAATFNVFPNPNTGNFFLQSEQPYAYNIYDLNGRLIHSGQGGIGITTISVDLKNGIYILETLFGHESQRRKIQIME